MPTGIRSHTGGVSTSPVSQVKMPSLLHVFVFVTATPSASLSAADGGPHGYPCSRPRAVDARPLLVTSAVCASSLLTRGCLSLLLYLHHMFRVKMALHIYGAQLLSLFLRVFCVSLRECLPVVHLIHGLAFHGFSYVVNRRLQISNGKLQKETVHKF